MPNNDPAANAGNSGAGIAPASGAPSVGRPPAGEPPATSDPSKTKLALTGGAGALAGAFAFGLFSDLGMKELFAGANTAIAIIFATMVFCLLALLILVTGYLVLTGGKVQQTSPSLWAPVAIFGLVALLGASAVTFEYIRNPGAMVNAYIGANSDLSQLNIKPPVIAFLNGDPQKLIVGVGKQNAKHIHVDDNGDLVIDFGNFYDLRRRLQDLRAESEGGTDVLALLKKACDFVPQSSDLRASCSTMSNSKPDRGL